MEGFVDGVGLDGKAAKGIGVHVGSVDLLFQPPYVCNPWQLPMRYIDCLICHSMKLMLRVLLKRCF
jgi:hypothetical protein